MPLKLYKRPNGIFYLRGTVQDRRFDESTRTRDRGQAEQIRAKAEADAFRAHVYGEPSVKTFAEQATDYMRAGGERDHIAPLLLAIGHRLVSEIGQREIDAIAADRVSAAARQGRTLAPATLIRQIYTPAAAILNHERASKITFRKPPVRNARTAFLQPSEAQAVLDAIPPHLARLVVFYLATGCRASEALALDWQDVSPEGERVVFWRTKAGYPRGVDLIAKARLALPARGTGPVFRNQFGEPWHAYDAVNLMLKKHGERAGLPHVHCHLFRHTWATWAYAMTRDLTFVMQQGGWRSLALLGRYTHAASPDLASAAKAHGWEIIGRSAAFPI